MLLNCRSSVCNNVNQESIKPIREMFQNTFYLWLTAVIKFLTIIYNRQDKQMSHHRECAWTMTDMLLHAWSFLSSLSHFHMQL